jgi:hypothetical protein
MIQFRTADERAAMKKRRKHLRGMRKGVDNSRMQNRGGEYGGAITNEEQRNIQSGQEKIRSNIENIGISTATQLATGGLGKIVANPLSSKLASSDFITNLTPDPAQQAKAVGKIVSKTQSLINKVPRAIGQITKGEDNRLMTPSVMELASYAVNPGAEEAVEPSGPDYQYDFFTPYSFDE